MLISNIFILPFCKLFVKIVLQVSFLEISSSFLGHKLCQTEICKKCQFKLYSNPWFGSTSSDSFQDDSSIMYMNRSPGINILGSMLKNICSQAIIALIFTKQSLRATSITVSDCSTCGSILLIVWLYMDVNPKPPLKNNKRKPSETRIHEPIL